MSASANDARRVESTVRGRWQVERWRGGASALHDLAWPDPIIPTVWLLEVDRPALVLGSTQAESDVDGELLERSGIELARRRSGGGAVHLTPQGQLWLDVLIPRGDLRWDDDVSRSFHWLGRAWHDALRGLGIAAEVHDGPLVCGAFGRRVCFAALGSGEVSVADAKLVGLSQRRTRAGARLQCTCYRVWDPEPMAALGVDATALPPVATVSADLDVLEAAVLAALG
jgi:lipoate-protein ligase A